MGIWIEVNLVPVVTTSGFPEVVDCVIGVIGVAVNIVAVVSVTGVGVVGVTLVSVTGVFAVVVSVNLVVDWVVLGVVVSERNISAVAFHFINSEASPS